LGGAASARSAFPAEPDRALRAASAMCNCRPIGRWLPVLFVVTLITWCYFVFTADIVVPMLRSSDESTKAFGRGYCIAFNILFALGVVSLVRAVFTEPGRIPDSWIVGAEDSEVGAFIPQLQTLETKHDGTRRVCRKSKPNMYKPDRAHYCRMLGRCVLKMDHFCPWLNNCIGFFNHKFFVLFIGYMACLTVFMVVVMTPVFVRHVSTMEEVTLDFKEEFRVSLTYLMLCLLSAGLTAFFGFHAYLVGANYTTIEFLEKRGCNPAPDHVNRYSIGLWGNITSVLGSSPLVWPLPVRWTCEGDGLAYKLNPAWFPTNKGK